MLAQVLLTVLLSKAAVGVYYDSYTGEEASEELVAEYESLGILSNCTSDIAMPCDDAETRVDGACQNPDSPASGTIHTTLRRLVECSYDVDEEAQIYSTGDAKPPERYVRTQLLGEGRASDLVYSQFIAAIPAGIFADKGSVHDTVNYIMETTDCCTEAGSSNNMCVPMEVQADDPVLRYTDIRCLNLTRPKTYQNTGCAAASAVQDRYTVNTPYCDLSYIYYAKEPAPEYRSYEGGKLLVEQEDDSDWPWSLGPHNVTSCYANVREDGEDRCWGVVQGSIPPVTMLTVWFYRLHNVLAEGLASVNPHWTDEQLFNAARKMNIAINNQMNIYELMPKLVGKERALKRGIISEDSGWRNIYNSSIKPQSLAEFMYALRWFHAVQEGKISHYDEDNNYLKEETVLNHTLRVGHFSKDNNLVEELRGLFLDPTAAHDNIADPDMCGQGLGGLQRFTDLLSADLAKGRYLCIGTYVEYLEYFGYEKPTTWEDMEKHFSLESIEIFKKIYPGPEKLELLSALWRELPEEGAFMPPIAAEILANEMYYTIITDKYYYENENIFTEAQLAELRKATYAGMLCAVEPKLKTITREVLLRVSDDNPVVNCSDIEIWSYDAWAESTDA